MFVFVDFSDRFRLIELLKTTALIKMIIFFKKVSFKCRVSIKSVYFGFWMNSIFFLHAIQDVFSSEVINVARDHFMRWIGYLGSILQTIREV